MGRRYVIENGDIWTETTGPDGRRIDLMHVADGSGLLAVAYAAEDGTTLRHGSAAAVQQWRNSAKGMAAAVAMGDVTVVTFPAHPACVELLNVCSENSTRMIGFIDELTDLAVKHPEITWPAWEPKTRPL